MLQAPYLIRINCSHFTEFERELAAYISERLEGTALALVRDKEIAIDWISDAHVSSPPRVLSIVESFLAGKNLSAEYTLRLDEELIEIVAPAGMPIHKSQRKPDLPPNLFQCTHCGYVAPTEELHRLHERLHYLSF